jgi:hypothetical protein
VSYLRINLIDSSEARNGEVHGGVSDRLIAALSAEPETISELELALARFQEPTDDAPLSLPFHAGENFAPFDAGIVIIDLIARVLMVDSTYSAPQAISDEADEMTEAVPLCAESEPTAMRPREMPTTYGVHYHNGECLTNTFLPYRVPEDWLFVTSVAAYEGVRGEREAARRSIVWRDSREVLFGMPLCTFIAQEIFAAAECEAEELMTNVHIRWLMTERNDLQGHSPREVLLERLEYIDFDLHSRQLQWSLLGECPPSLLPSSHAYRFGGYGTHQNVVYYDLVRILLREAVAHGMEDPRATVTEEAERLLKIRNVWLETPDDEYQGKAPGLVMDWERRRTPMAISGKAAMIDDDCPICRAMADELNGPFFWHLDGSGMDYRFEFSFHKTMAEWEAERLEWEEFSKRHRVSERAFTVGQSVF